MNYANALGRAIKIRNVSIDILARQMYVQQSWIKKILKNPTWNPRLDTIVHFCYCLDIDIFDFLMLGQPNNSVNTATPSYAQLRKCGIQRKLILNLKPTHVTNSLLFFRKNINLTCTLLCTKTEFQLSSISLRESSRYTNLPTMQTIELYCQAFNISLGVFMDRLFFFVSLDSATYEDSDLTQSHNRWNRPGS
jgi:hypothetical protein